jgi:hypothetical protein
MIRGNFPPAHLEAKTPEELRVLMMANNAKHKKQFHYFDFSFAQGKWHCWFEISSQDLIGIKKADDSER